jgi:hypothetical protein
MINRSGHQKGAVHSKRHPALNLRGAAVYGRVIESATEMTLNMSDNIHKT